MQATSRIAPVASRTVARRSTVIARRRFATEAPSTASRGVDVSHAAAGVAGGVVVLGGMYIYYRQSGTAKVVATTKQFVDGASSAKDQLANSVPSLKQSSDLLKSISKSYLAAVPGAGYAIDQVFTKIDELGEKHGKELEELMSKTYQEVQAAVKDGNGGEKIMQSLQNAAQRLQELAGEQGGKYMNAILEKNPELKKVVGASSDELNKLGDKYGPEAKKLAEETYSQISDLVKNGGLNAKTYEQAKKLIEEKTKQISDLAQKGSSDAWEASSKAASPLLEKMPDVKKMLDEKLGGLKGIVGEDNVKAVKDMYAELEKIQKNNSSAEDKAKAAKKLVEERIGSLGDLKSKASKGASQAASQAQDVLPDWAHPESLAKYASAIPGFGVLSKVLGGEDLQRLKELAEKHGEDAEKILQATVEDIKKVLSKRLDEAKNVAGKATEDAKKEVKK